MRLEVAEFPVREIELGSRYGYRAGVMEIDREDLLRWVLQDSHLEQAELDVVMPGDPVRVTGIRDVVEPRVKIGGTAQIFPGILGPVDGVGAGLTHRLSGMAVIATAAYEGTIRAGTGAQRSALLDMSGAGAEASRFSSLANLVLVLRLKHGLAELAAHHAIQKAEFEIARRLAQVTQGLRPQYQMIYDLTAAPQPSPRVVLVQGCITHDRQPHSGLSYYGLPIRESLATTIHPHELIDGAITPNTTRGIGYYPTTWDWQNHPLALGLQREHAAGRLNFVGMILERISYDTHHGKEVIAHNTAQLAHGLGADAVLITWIGSGNAFIDLMLTIRACEKFGIQTVLVTYEYGGKDGVDSPLLYYVAEATAVVSTGSRDRWLELPPVRRVVGPYQEIKLLSYAGVPLSAANAALTLDARDMIIGGVDNWGRGAWTCKAH